LFRKARFTGNSVVAMCLSEIDLSPFLSECPPAPHDVWMEVSVSNNSDQTDVTVFKAHRLFLAAVSPVFQKTFYGSLGTSEKILRIPNTSPLAFRMFLEYIYHRDYNITLLEHHNLDCLENIQLLFELLKLADMYMMEKLMSQCEAALMSGVLVTKENIFQLAKISLEYSCYSRPAETILAKCARFLKMEISRNFGVLKLLGKDDYEIFQILVDRSEMSQELLPPEEIQAEQMMAAGGIFPIDEVPNEQLNIPNLSIDSTARQTGVVRCLTRMSDSTKELTCFSSYDRYSKTGQMEDSLVVAEVFQKYLLRNNEPFLFYCRIPPYAKRMFGGSPETAGFLDIQWADIVFILVTRGSVSCVVGNNLVRMNEGDILRFDTMNTSGIWNMSPKFCEIIVIAHE